MTNLKYKTPFSFEERQQIEALLKTPISISEISRRIGRSKNGVIEEVRKNGGRAVYNAQEAQNGYHYRNMLRIQNMRDQIPGIKTISLKEEIEVLKMQLDIALDLLKQQR